MDTDQRILAVGDVVSVIGAVENSTPARSNAGADEWCRAYVTIASPVNGDECQSVGLTLMGLVRAQGGWIGGSLALTVDYRKCRVTGLDGSEYIIDV